MICNKRRYLVGTPRYKVIIFQSGNHLSFIRKRTVTENDEDYDDDDTRKEINNKSGMGIENARKLLL